MKLYQLVFVFAIGVILTTITQQSAYSFGDKGKPVNPVDTFPVPPKSDKLLFYIQRSPNINTIMYELNVDEKGVLNKEEPIHVYWIRYADEIKKNAELSYIQRKYAYGVTTRLIDAEKQIYQVYFVSYSKRNIYLIKSKMTVNTMFTQRLKESLTD